MEEVFIGSEAVSAGRLTRYELQRWYRPIFRGVYVPKSSTPSLRDRTVGAWLASDRQAVIAGAAASALHDAQWVDDDIPIELISTRARPQRGLLVRNETLGDGEITKIAGLPVTTRARTAFDLGRHLPRGKALARLDALMRAQVFSRTSSCLPNTIRVSADCGNCVSSFRSSTAAPHHRRRPGSGCYSSTLDFPGPPPKFLW
jgi:hypothetical protein